MRLERLTVPVSALHLWTLLRAHDGTSLEPRNDEDRPWTLTGGTGLDASIITHIPSTAKQFFTYPSGLGSCRGLKREPHKVALCESMKGARNGY
ncbi:MAG: hypothetical protein PUJ98_02420 [Mobiluncus porci]|uniref:hypothetical protein n=1 Tax=Mobiluncus porci TaxID=2652278 RepID=UPI0023F2E9B2|nr:hypothetical protein [Mobiluncus porci]MDD7541059.1 hypothetical protein [Mobiluncus porci]